MRLSLLVGLLALAIPAGALAKEPLSATIDGPGVAGRLEIAGPRDGSPSAFGRLVVLAGVPPAMFGHRSPDPMRRHQPDSTLGPRYEITWIAPGPDGRDYKLLQDAYPYATPRPLTYMEPGQPFFQGFRTHGGWYVAGPALRRALVAAGLPPSRPGGSDGDALGLWQLSLIGACALAAFALVGAAGWLRRKPKIAM